MGVTSIVILTGMLFSGCSRSGSSESPYLLTYWSSNNPHEITLALEVVKQWNELHPAWLVKHQPIPEGRSSEEVILAAIVSNTTPDIYSNLWPGTAQQYVEAGVVVRMDTLPGFDSLFTSRIPVELHDQFRSKDGFIYQMAWKCNPIVLYYNRQLFKENGITAPLKTYSDYFAAAEILTQDLDHDGYFDQWMMDIDINTEWWHRFFDFYTFYIAASGGSTLIGADNEITIDSPVGKAVFDFLSKGFQRGYFPNAFFQGDVFLQGKVATHISGPWNIAHIEKFRPEGFQYGIMPIPVPDDYQGKLYTYGDPKNICIFASTKRPAIAWEFVKFMVSRSNDKKLLDITNQMPIRAGLLTDSLFYNYFYEYPQYRFFAEMIPNIGGADQSIYLQEMFDIISQEFDAACLHGMKSSAEALRDAAQRCQVLVLREKT